MSRLRWQTEYRSLFLRIWRIIVRMIAFARIMVGLKVNFLNFVLDEWGGRYYIRKQSDVRKESLKSSQEKKEYGCLTKLA